MEPRLDGVGVERRQGAEIGEDLVVPVTWGYSSASHEGSLAVGHEEDAAEPRRVPGDGAQRIAEFVDLNVPRVVGGRVVQGDCPIPSRRWLFFRCQAESEPSTQVKTASMSPRFGAGGASCAGDEIDTDVRSGGELADLVARNSEDADGARTGGGAGEQRAVAPPVRP